MAQTVASRLAVWQARVRISARHPRGGPLPSGSNEEIKSGTRQVLYIKILYVCSVNVKKILKKESSLETIKGSWEPEEERCHQLPRTKLPSKSNRIIVTRNTELAIVTGVIFTSSSFCLLLSFSSKWCLMGHPPPPHQYLISLCI